MPIRMNVGRMILCSLLVVSCKVWPKTELMQKEASIMPSQPGIQRAILSPVSTEQDQQAMNARAAASKAKKVAGFDASSETDIQTMRVGGDASPVGPASISELARALRNDPDLIYEYVRNNIGYYPIWGVQKGPVGTILDNQGTSFDQAALMVSLLREAGYTASFVKGRISLNAAQIRSWLGIDTSNVCGVINLFAQGQVPTASVVASAAYSCPGSSASLVSMKLDHVWVKVAINGSEYHFDPSYKPHTVKSGISNLSTAMGYNAATYLSSAKTGATLTADSILMPNRSNIHANLQSYATTLANYLRSNYPTAGLDDIIGGKTIIHHNGAKLRQTALSYVDSSVALTVWSGDIPDAYRPTLRIRYAGFDRTFTSDAIYGKRLSISYDYNAANQPYAYLMLDGQSRATGHSFNALNPNSVDTITFDVTHPYATNGANQSFTQTIKASGVYVIGNAWGPGGRGSIELHRKRLRESQGFGAAPESEVALGSALAVLSSTWIAQVNHSNHITDRLAKTNTLFHHQIGIAGYNTAPYVDLPGNMISLVSEGANPAKEEAAFFSAAMRASIFESTAVRQTTGVRAVSTVKLIDIAAANGDKIFDAKPSNFTSVVRPALISCASNMSAFQSAVNAGRRLILPSRCNISEQDWSGAGYFDISSGSSGRSIGAIIGGGLAGGFASTNLPAPQTNQNVSSNIVSPNIKTQTTGFTFGDPIDMAKGNYLYAKEDLSVGIGPFPMSLSLQRSYSSGSDEDIGFGGGWTHNFYIRAKVGSDGMQSMGEDSALDAVNAIVEQFVSLDLLSDAAKPLDKLVVTTLGQSWLGDQLVNNIVVVTQGLNGEIFVKLPDGTYNAPPGNPAKLTKHSSGSISYTYETLDRARMTFYPQGEIMSYIHPSGIRANFIYDRDPVTAWQHGFYITPRLVKVENSLGNWLEFSYYSKAARVSTVGARWVDYDLSDSLRKVTDPLGNVTRYHYDSRGLMLRVFNPLSGADIPFLVNEYDSLGRVRKQTNVHGQSYFYYFAGSRSEEVAPDGSSKISYLDANGKVLKSIDELGRSTSTAYDTQGRPIRQVLPEGNAVEYVYDDAPCTAQQRCTHNIKVVRNIPKSNSNLPTLTRSFTYENNFNKVATETDPKGLITSYTYTSQGYPLTVTSPADSSGIQPVISYGYSSYTLAGFPTFYLPTSTTIKSSGSNSIVNTTAYLTDNGYVRPSKTVIDSGSGKLNITTSYQYDSYGDLRQVNGPRTDVTDVFDYDYDANRRLILENTNAQGTRPIRYAYDAGGNLIRTATMISSNVWSVSCNSYSSSGKLKKSWGPSERPDYTSCPPAASPVSVTDYDYDALDRLYRITQNLPVAEGGSRVTETTYNADGSVATVKRAVGTGIAQIYATNTYTANGLLSTARDARGNLTTFEYDGHDRKLSIRFPHKTSAGISSDTDFERFTYDANSNLTNFRRRNGQNITFVYDNLNRMLSRSYSGVTESVDYSYDLLGRRTGTVSGGRSISYQWDNAGRLLSATAGSRTLGYQYDAAGNRIRTTWPDAFYVTTSYDTFNRVTNISESGSVSLATYSYDRLSRRTRVSLGNGTTTDYFYDAQGMPSKQVHNFLGSAQDVTYEYFRNQAGEIIRQTWTNNLYQWNGASNDSISYTSNGLNQYTAVKSSSLVYDANGNLGWDGTWSYTYDDENRLIEAASGVSPVNLKLNYDAEGRLDRYTRTTPSGQVAVDWLYDGEDVVAEYDNLGVLTQRYVHGPGIDEPVVRYQGIGASNKTWLHADYLGSVIAETNASGTGSASYTYGPFGEAGNFSTNLFRYTGQKYLSSLNLYYYKARFYSPQLGRFLQADPAGYEDGPNLYAYTQNNPINANDPDGQFVNFLIGAGTSVALGYGVSLITGESYSLSDAARDAALGAVGAGVVSKAAQLYQASRAASTASTLSRQAYQVRNVHTHRAARNHRTVAALSTSKGTVIAGGVRDLNPTQRALVNQMGATPAKQVGAHAEVTALNAAKAQGAAPRAIQTTLTICPACQETIKASGGVLVGETSAVWGAGTVSPFVTGGAGGVVGAASGALIGSK